MDIRYHFTKEAVERGVVSFKYVHTSEQAADGMTKGLAGPKTAEFRNMITGATAKITVETSCDSKKPDQTIMGIYHIRIRTTGRLF